MMKIGVLGAGSWGAALANHLTKNEHEVSRTDTVISNKTSLFIICNYYFFLFLFSLTP